MLLASLSVWRSGWGASCVGVPGSVYPESGTGLDSPAALGDVAVGAGSWDRIWNGGLFFWLVFGAGLGMGDLAVPWRVWCLGGLWIRVVACAGLLASGVGAVMGAAEQLCPLGSC